MARREPVDAGVNPPPSLPTRGALPLLPAPPPDILAGTPVHVLVRDWPETLVVLRRAGVDVAAVGSDALKGLPGGVTLIEACLEATAWRARVR